MNNEASKPLAISLTQLTQPIGVDSASCQLDGEGHCITCSDEALSVTVLSIDEAVGVALVTVQGATEEVDITLVENVAPGDTLLVHGGVAIGHAVGADSSRPSPIYRP